MMEHAGAKKVEHRDTWYRREMMVCRAGVVREET